MNKLSVIFVTFNSYKAVSDCLAQIHRNSRIKITVVDNNSQDNTPNLLRAQFPAVEIIKHDVNIGYGRAANVVLRSTNSPYALLLNPDLKVTSKDLNRLLDYACNDKSNTAIWGPATSRKDFTGDPPCEATWVSGSAMLFDVAKIRKVGLFDENIFLFSEETELCERTIKAGYGIKLCRNIFFDHMAGQSSPTSPSIEYMKWWHLGWSQCYRLSKNDPQKRPGSLRIKQLTYRLYSIISSSKSKRFKCKAKADGALAFIHGVKAFRDDGTPQMSPDP